MEQFKRLVSLVLWLIYPVYYEQVYVASERLYDVCYHRVVAVTIVVHPGPAHTGEAVVTIVVHPGPAHTGEAVVTIVVHSGPAHTGEAVVVADRT
jgi:hypothetical protein